MIVVPVHRVYHIEAKLSKVVRVEHFVYQIIQVWELTIHSSQQLNGGFGCLSMGKVGFPLFQRR